MTPASGTSLIWIKLQNDHAAQSVLRFRYRHRKSVKRGRRNDLARKPTILLGHARKLEHFAFQLLHRRQTFEPFRRYVDVARRARAGATAIAVDPRYAIFGRCVHQRLALADLDRVARAIVFDVGDLNQESVSTHPSSSRSNFARAGGPRLDAGQQIRRPPKFESPSAFAKQKRRPKGRRS